MKFKLTLLALGLSLFLGCSNAISSASLSTKEAKTLTFMAEEEKVARDVYRTLYGQWNIQAFANISGAEQRHLDRLLSTLSQYQLANPVTDDTTGEFSNPELKQLYTKLLIKGQKSSLDALMVGAYIEELDIKDLQEAIAGSSHADIKQTYENLMRGSRNHLRAFVRQISNQGQTYNAQVLPQAEVDQIVNSAMERGGKRGGGKGERGQGQRGQGKGQQGMGRGLNQHGR